MDAHDLGSLLGRIYNQAAIRVLWVVPYSQETQVSANYPLIRNDLIRFYLDGQAGNILCQPGITGWGAIGQDVLPSQTLGQGFLVRQIGYRLRIKTLPYIGVDLLLNTLVLFMGRQDNYQRYIIKG